jgi:hypothetical protein
MNVDEKEIARLRRIEEAARGYVVAATRAPNNRSQQEIDDAVQELVDALAEGGDHVDA